MKKHWVALLILTTGVLAAHFLVFHLIHWALNPAIFGLYAYMISLSIVFERVLMNEPDAKKFINYYMAFSGGKLMLSLFILIVYALFQQEFIVPFAISFLIVYFSYTALEIVRLVRHLKNI